ncbi:MAG: bifunctional (p)ppGpp synthetase/guanosine-3',5'-bis(diphosphate) 3'-pyrophosphohydrolase [Lachnospiraceae bacterium]|nr:bifunctional (p)ppGpp synthetase/guanosine-3',5'-bis(diphosphate) 3'-pyrophosphohydrolase [Lachnospiraceae bacterium]
MVYTPLVNKAIKIAYSAHENQKDAAGIPYILHPIHLAEQMNNETRTCIALLHDVVEDTDVTLEELEKEFPPEITDAIRLLTHTNEDYYEYVEKICTSLDACFVKVADIIHNMDETRLCKNDLDDSEKDRWIIKYSKALCMIVTALENKIPYSNSINDTDRKLLDELLRRYRYPNRIVAIECDKNPLDYMTEDAFEIFSGKSYEEQMECINIDVYEKTIHDFRNVEKYEKKYTKSMISYEYNRLILVSQGVVLGLIRVNNECGYNPKNRASYMWINNDFEVKEYRYIDHKRDNMATGQDIDVHCMWLDVELIRIRDKYEMELEFDEIVTTILERYYHCDENVEKRHSVISINIRRDNLLTDSDGKTIGVKYAGKKLLFDENQDVVEAEYNVESDRHWGNYPDGAYTKEITEITGVIRLKRKVRV